MKLFSAFRKENQRFFSFDRIIFGAKFIFFFFKNYKNSNISKVVKLEISIFGAKIQTDFSRDTFLIQITIYFRYVELERVQISNQILQIVFDICRSDIS